MIIKLLIMWIDFHLFLLPFFKIEDKLLWLIVYTDYILDNILNIISIFAKIPNYNIVKPFF